MKDLRTGLVLRDAGSRGQGVDVTGLVKETSSFYDVNGNVLYVALPKLPRGLMPELVCGTNVCDLLGMGRENVGVVSALLGSRGGDFGGINVALKAGGGGEGGAEKGRGVAGVRVTAGDEENVELRPVKAFGDGEVVCVRNETGDLVYGAVVGVGEGEEGSVKVVKVDLGGGRVGEMMSSEIYSFVGRKRGGRGEEGGAKEGVRVVIDESLLEIASGGGEEEGSASRGNTASTSTHTLGTHTAVIAARSRMNRQRGTPT